MAKRWYIVHAYSNFEKKVAESIREQAQARGYADLFEEILVLGVQAWLTGTDTEPFEQFLTNSQHFSVDHGHISLS